MATTALTALRQELALRAGDYYPLQFATTTNIGAGVSIVSTQLPNNGFTVDDLFNNIAWVIINDGSANLGVSRLLTDYAQSTGTLTVAGANLASESAARNFEVHKFNPVMLREILNAARLDAFPLVNQYIVNEDLFTAPGQRRWALPSQLAEPAKLKQVWLSRIPSAETYSENLLSNGGFEAWVGAVPTGWAATGSVNLTLAQVTSLSRPQEIAVLAGSASARALSDGTNAGVMIQAITGDALARASGQRLSFSVWVYCLRSAAVRARITLASTTSYSQYHAGQGWEKLSVTVVSQGALTALTCGVEIDASIAATRFFVDEAILVRGQSGPVEEEYEPLLNWQVDHVTGVANDPMGIATDSILRLPYAVPSARQLRLIAVAPLSSVSAEGDTMELAGPQTELLYAFALVRLYRQLKAQTGHSDRWDTPLRDAVRELERAKRVHAMPMPVLKQHAPGWEY